MYSKNVMPILGFLLLSCGVAGPTRAGIDEADAAYGREDHAAALALYEEVLEDEPENLRALIRSARLLSWEGRLQESIDRYDRALAVAPQDRHAALGRAVVLSWDGRLEQSIAELDELHTRNPDDREIRLALARTLAWNGDYPRARDHYQDLLARDSGDIEALLGTARTYAWSGHLTRAREWYDRALVLDSDNKDAQVGRGYLDLWTGDLSRASSSASALIALHPEDKDVLEFNEKVRRATAPAIRARSDRTDDTDDNRLLVNRISGEWSPTRGVGLEIGVARFDMEDRVSSASIEHAHAAIHLRPARSQKLTLHLGVDRREATSGATESDLLGGAAYAWGLDRRWQFRLSAVRDGLRYSPLITDNGITIDEYEVAATGDVASRWRLGFHTGGASVSDGNDRVNFLGTASYRLPVTGLIVETGYVLRFFDYDQDLDSGYFDASDFNSHMARLNGRGEFGASRRTYRFGLDAGFQSFTLTNVDVNNDFVVVVSGAMGFPLGRSFTLEFFGNWGDYAAQNAGGFESRQLGLRLLWRDGR